MRHITSLFFVLISFFSLGVNATTPAPEFSLPQINQDESISLSDYKGKVVYLDFWASWCGPCRKSLPLLNELRLELKDKPFEVIAINLDEDIEDARQFLKEYPVTYPTLYDKDNATPRLYQLRGMPTSYLIDKNGIIQSTHQGFKPSHMPKIRQSVIDLLGE